MTHGWWQQNSSIFDLTTWPLLLTNRKLIVVLLFIWKAIRWLGFLACHQPSITVITDIYRRQGERRRRRRKWASSSSDTYKLSWSTHTVDFLRRNTSLTRTHHPIEGGALQVAVVDSTEVTLASMRPAFDATQHTDMSQTGCHWAATKIWVKIVKPERCFFQQRREMN